MRNKFKVWCKNSKAWERHSTFIGEEGRLFQLRHPRGLGLLSPDTHEVVWFIGRLDAHGEEIYEDDILLHPNGKTIGVVKFKERHSRYVVARPDGSFIIGDFNKWKKVGNVRENPELLEAG